MIHVCKLKKDLYGLKQAPRAWYGKIDSFLASMDFTKSKIDPNLYLKVMDDEPLILLLYVDDTIAKYPFGDGFVLQRFS